jgi:signal transduction histidine kinase
MGALKRTPLFRKVLVGIIAVFGLVAVALSIGSAWQLDRSLRIEFRSKGSAIASSIASSAVELLVNRDASTLQATIDQFLEIRGVAYVFVLDDEHEIVAHTFVPLVPEAIRRSAIDQRARGGDAISVTELDVPGVGSYLDVAAPILAGVAGTTHVGMDLGVITGDVRTAILRQQGVLLGVFVVSLVLAYVFVNRTARPLQELTGHVRGIAESGFQHLEPDRRVEQLAERSRDEVGDLARAFLAMSSTIGRHIKDLQHARDELAEYSQSLERRVEARTAELVEKNRALEGALSRLKEAQEQIVSQEKLASLGALTAGIAHEIKNPLNFVNNFAQLSEELAAELREAVSRAVPSEAAADIVDTIDMLQMNVSKINEHGRRADSIVRNMLLHSRGRKGEATAVDLNALVHEYVGLAYHGMRGQDSSFNAKIEEHYDPEVGQVSVIPQDMSRALLNILTNACYVLREKARQSGAGYAPILTVSTKSVGERVEIRIRDNGQGIPPEVRERLFEPFFTTKPAGSGTGLGLSITFDIIVKGHGGDIDVETEVGRFTEFIVTLPRGIDRRPVAAVGEQLS